MIEVVGWGYVGVTRAKASADEAECVDRDARDPRTAVLAILNVNVLVVWGSETSHDEPIEAVDFSNVSLV